MCKRTAIAALSVALLLALTSAMLGEQGHAPEDTRAVLHKTQPNYPELARRLNLSGFVTVKVAVAADGHVKSATVVSGNPILGQAASSAVREWLFVPGADESVNIGINFSLQ